MEKSYVDVICLHKADGTLQPLKIILEDGRQYEIDKILAVESRASLKAGGLGIRYTVRINNRQTYMFYDEGKWFVEIK